MGFFDKVKTFVGGHGVDVAFTRIEKQDPAGSVVFPVTDSVLKARFDISAKGDATVLSTELVFICEKKHEDGRIEKVVLGKEEHTTGTFADEIPFPHKMKSGEKITDGWVMIRLDIPGKLEKMGYADANAALSAPELRFYIKAEADVEGSPFDPTAEKDITLRPSG